MQPKQVFFIHLDDENNHHDPCKGDNRLIIQDRNDKIVGYAGAHWGSYDLNQNRDVNVENKALANDQITRDKSNRIYCKYWTIRDGGRNEFDKWLEELGYHVQVSEDIEIDLAPK